MEHGATWDGSTTLDGGAVRREMGCTAGNTAAAEQQAHAQPHAMGEHGGGRYFERVMGRCKEAGLLDHAGPESDV